MYLHRSRASISFLHRHLALLLSYFFVFTYISRYIYASFVFAHFIPYLHRVGKHQRQTADFTHPPLLTLQYVDAHSALWCSVRIFSFRHYSDFKYYCKIYAKPSRAYFTYKYRLFELLGVYIAQLQLDHYGIRKRCKFIYKNTARPFRKFHFSQW